MAVFTIGYEGLDIDAFMALLAENDIDTVVDVRELPLSRKRGFSKRALATALQQLGYEYRHIAALGCPKPVRNRYREDGDWQRYTEGFLEYLSTQTTAISELSKLVCKSNCALLCYEADYNFCHRSMVANAVHDQCGATVRHIEICNVKRASPGGLLLTFA